MFCRLTNSCRVSGKRRQDLLQLTYRLWDPRPWSMPGTTLFHRRDCVDARLALAEDRFDRGAGTGLGGEQQQTQATAPTRCGMPIADMARELQAYRSFIAG